MDELHTFDYLPWAQEQIENAEIDYQKTGNALHAWYAYSLCRRFGLPVPAWVQNYLDRVAMNFLRLLQPADELPPEQRPGPITDALEMPAPGKAFKQVNGSSFMPIGINVQWAMQTTGLQETYAIEQVAAKHGISASTVRRYWMRFQELMGSSKKPAEK